MIFKANITLNLTLTVESGTHVGAELLARLRAPRVAITSEHITAVSVTSLSVDEMLQHDHHRLWQERQAAGVGKPNQLARYERGSLPEQELLALARNELFEPFAVPFRRRQRMTATDIHDDEPCTGEVIWSTIPNPRLTDRQWRTWRHIEDTLADAMSHPWMYLSSREDGTAQMLEHRGSCPACMGHRAHQSALVSIVWAGRTLSREYLL